MRCLALRGFYLAEVAIKKGDLVEVPDHLVRQLALVGKIEPAPLPVAVKQDPAQVAAEVVQKWAPKHAPMTTQTATALVPGAHHTKKDHHHD